MTSGPWAPELTERVVLQRLRIIVCALAGGVALCSAVGWYVGQGQPSVEAATPLPIAWLVVAAVAAGAGIADRVIRSARLARLRAAGHPPDGGAREIAPEILAAYQEVTILRAALIEAPSLLACVFFLLLGDVRLLWAVGAGLALFVLSMPSSEKLRRFAAAARGLV